MIAFAQLVNLLVLVNIANLEPWPIREILTPVTSPPPYPFNLMSTSVMMSSSQSSTPNGNLKKRIRDTTRLLTRSNLPADMRREMERKLAALQGALAEKSQNDLEREMAIKYRMVKFFERKKAMRKLVSAQRSGNDEAVKAAQLDLAYILHYPKDLKYISLYPKEASSEAVVAQREAIRKEISEKVALLGAETMLGKVLKAKAADLQDSADDDDSDDDDEDDEDSENDSDDDDDDSNNSDDEDSEDDLDGDSDEDSDDDNEFDSDDDSEDDEGEFNEEEDSSDDGYFSSEEDGGEDDNGEFSTDDESSSHDENDFNSCSDEGYEEDSDEYDEESEVEEVPSKKTRRH